MDSVKFSSLHNIKLGRSLIIHVVSFVHADDMVENDESLFSITSVMLCWVNVAMNGSQNKKMVTVNQTQAKKVSLHIVTKTFPIFDFSIYREKG